MKQDRFALDEYAHYVCDDCGQRIGADGWITLRQNIVWRSVCDQCRRKGSA